jgi:hypothetical protein
MNSYSNLNSDMNSSVYSRENRRVNTKANSVTNSISYNSQHIEHYTTMDLCSQAKMLEDADNILSRMDKLRAFAREQQSKRATSQRQQTSFCF